MNISPLSYRTLLYFALPAIAAVGLEPVAEMIDTAILGQVQSKWVAALAATNAFLASFAWIFNFLAYRATAQIALEIGKGRKDLAGIQIKLSLCLALFLGLTVSLILYFGESFCLLKIMNLNEEIAQLAAPYWRVRVLGFFLTLLSAAIIGILRGLQQIFLSMCLITSMTVVNAIGTYLAVFHLGWGMAGAASATVGGFLLSNIIACIWFYKNRQEYNLDTTWLVDWHDLLALGKDGLNLMGRTGCLIVAFFLLTASASRMGSTTLAAHQIAMQVWLFAAYILDGLAVTATFFGAKLSGEKAFEQHKIMSKKLIICALFIGLFFAGAYTLGRSFIISIFTHDTFVVVALVSIWPLIAIMQVINALVYIYDGIFFGLHEFAFLRKRMTEGFLIFLPLLIIAIFYMYSLLGLWIALMGLNFYRLLSSFYKFHRLKPI